MLPETLLEALTETLAKSIGVTMDKDTERPGHENESPNPLMKILTFKAGNFTFSRKYDRQAVRENLVHFEGLFQALRQLPILPNQAARLDTELVRRSIFGTAAIEGNPLSEERVDELLAEPAAESGTGLRERAEQEILNLKQAYARFTVPPKDKKREPLRVTEALILEINRVITANIASNQHTPGQYRNIKVEVGDGAHGGKYTPPKILADVKKLMAAFVDWINSEAVVREGALIRAALAHYHLGLIHPFGDGNGRTARLLEAAILIQEGYKYVPAVLSNHYYQSMDDYYIAFRETEHAKDGGVTPFLVFFARMLLKSVQDVQERVHTFIRLLALRDYYRFCLEQRDITRRQHDLLQLLLTPSGKEFTLRDLLLDPLFAPLYRRVSEKTARRDLERLTEHKLLLRNDQKRYFANPFALGD